MRWERNNTNNPNLHNVQDPYRPLREWHPDDRNFIVRAVVNCCSYFENCLGNKTQEIFRKTEENVSNSDHQTNSLDKTIESTASPIHNPNDVL